jgi:hypothetical protein
MSQGDLESCVTEEMDSFEQGPVATVAIPQITETLPEDAESHTQNDKKDQTIEQASMLEATPWHTVVIFAFLSIILGVIALGLAYKKRGEIKKAHWQGLVYGMVIKMCIAAICLIIAIFHQTVSETLISLTFFVVL